MATLAKRKNKKGTVRYEIQYYTEGGRRSISLGSAYNEKQAKRIATYVEALISCVETGTRPDASLAAWLENLDDDLRERLAKADLLLITERMTHGAVWRRFYESPRFQRMAPNTTRNYRGVATRFFEFFDEKQPVDEATKVDAEEWRRAIIDAGYAEATAAGAVKCVRSVYNWAVDSNLIESHPFDAVYRGSFKNKKREFFVSREWYVKLLENCPDQDWRTILALCRIGGLRCPSEVLEARWDDVNWEKERFAVRDRKRKTTRVIPLFPELREELDKQFFANQGGDCPYIVAHHRFDSNNLRTGLSRIIFHAGLPQWERIFHNLRGSRSCELFSEQPAHVASAWMGQSEKVANAHYLHPTDEDFRRALEPGKDAAALSSVAKSPDSKTPAVA
ncbi:MAG: tyrosine-type recombinase/integrase [Thermoguttaceae bacterium]|nr:tyrosine-type recombinase/integrase [Thermoguttaceae bacterium]MBQ9800754.1 tyrosine-type recombinase/integrase [Thermoguttaceae bacterium]